MHSIIRHRLPGAAVPGRERVGGWGLDNSCVLQGVDYCQDIEWQYETGMYEPPASGQFLHEAEPHQETGYYHEANRNIQGHAGSQIGIELCGSTDLLGEMHGNEHERHQVAYVVCVKQKLESSLCAAFCVGVNRSVDSDKPEPDPGQQVSQIHRFNVWAWIPPPIVGADRQNDGRHYDQYRYQQVSIPHCSDQLPDCLAGVLTRSTDCARLTGFRYSGI